MTSVEQRFQAHADRIPPQGLGLSVDVYTPDLFELTEALDRRGLGYGYLEIFKASQAALTDVRRRLPRARFQYHADGLWITQPRLGRSVQFRTALDTAVEQLATLGCSWMNHECGTKQMAGYAFGTYLPPLFTEASADVVAENAALIEDRLADSRCFPQGQEPVLLLEIPPLTYFAFGGLSVADFFRRIAAQASCGLVLDIGHVWTVYRYTGAWRRRRLPEFLAEFLDVFPLERVVEIHLAGLDLHRPDEVVPGAWDSMASVRDSSGPPLWIDAHGSPIPAVLWDMLAQVLSGPRLRHLKGVALEVDTKAIGRIVTEYDRLLAQFGTSFSGVAEVAPDTGRDCGAVALHTSAHRAHEVDRQYDQYARIVTHRSGRTTFPGPPLPGSDSETLDLYRRRYLPHEIVTWGGDLRDMFPQTCRILDEHVVSLSAFVEYWVHRPRVFDADYDFFLLKLAWFVAFVKEAAPDAGKTAEREAHELRAAYRAASDFAGHDSPSAGHPSRDHQQAATDHAR